MGVRESNTRHLRPRNHHNQSFFGDRTVLWSDYEVRTVSGGSDTNAKLQKVKTTEGEDQTLKGHSGPGELKKRTGSGSKGKEEA